MKKENNFFSSFFNIKKTIFEKNHENNNFELFFEEHFEELRQRLIQSFCIICIFTLIAFLNINSIVKILQKPVSSIKFFQLSPGEYFISTIETSVFFGLLVCSPIFFNQLIFFLFPGLNEKEKIIVPFLTISSILLFFLGLVFSYFILIPVTLGFFITYGKDSIEPLLSYNQYISFIGVMFFGTGILFQIPIIQILMCLLNIVSGQKMLESWKYIIIGSTIISAIFTPSADPLTQVLLASVLVVLYLGGAFVSIFLKPI
jgi:sec-independent protein translocase protein TatC